MDEKFKEIRGFNRTYMPSNHIIFNMGMDGYVDGYVDIWMDIRMDMWMDGYMDGCISFKRMMHIDTLSLKRTWAGEIPEPPSIHGPFLKTVGLKKLQKVVELQPLSTLVAY